MTRVSFFAEAANRTRLSRNKPHNIMITPRGQLKILDFGLAKQLRSSDAVDYEAPTESLLSTPGQVIGTMPYMSPEQVQGEPLDACSDIFQPRRKPSMKCWNGAR